MTYLNLIGYFVLVLSICGSVLTQSCVEQDCPSVVEESQSNLLPIPNDCTKFIMCDHGTKHIM